MKMLIEWYDYTVFLTGRVALPLLAIILLQKFVFTAGCLAAGWKCEYAETSVTKIASAKGR